MLSCNHCLTLSLFSVIFMSLKSPAASAALQPPPPPPPPVSLSRGSASLLFIFFVVVVVFIFLFLGRSSVFPFRSLTCFPFQLSDTPPSPLPAMRSPMVQCCACLQFCDWSVGLSPVRVQLCQLVQCCGLSSEWTMCIKLHSFLV